MITNNLVLASSSLAACQPQGSLRHPQGPCPTAPPRGGLRDCILSAPDELEPSLQSPGWGSPRPSLPGSLPGVLLRPFSIPKPVHILHASLSPTLRGRRTPAAYALLHHREEGLFAHSRLRDLSPGGEATVKVKQRGRGRRLEEGSELGCLCPHILFGAPESAKSSSQTLSSPALLPLWPQASSLGHDRPVRCSRRDPQRALDTWS